MVGHTGDTFISLLGKEKYKFNVYSPIIIFTAFTYIYNYEHKYIVNFSHLLFYNAFWIYYFHFTKVINIFNFIFIYSDYPFERSVKCIKNKNHEIRNEVNRI